MSYAHERQIAADFAAKALEAGFEVWLADSGTYGFYTDDAGKRVVSFGARFDGINLGGNYAASRESGTGWQMEDLISPDFATPKRLRNWLDANAPHWTKNHNPRYTTREDQLREYGPSSKYQRVTALAGGAEA